MNQIRSLAMPTGLTRALLAISLLLVLGTSVAIAANSPDVPTGTPGVPNLGPTPIFRGSTIAPGVPIQLAQRGPLAPRPANALLPLPDAYYNINLGVYAFSQNDSRWKNNTMQTCSLSIGSAGCVLTSAAMVFKYYGAQSKDPGQLNTCMGNSACPWYWASGANNCSESKATWYNSYAFDYSTLAWSLDNGWPAILELANGGNTHWVVIKSLIGDGTQDSQYGIIDPWDGQAKNLTSYTNSGYSKGTIAIYSRR
ncbi:MAG: hypothetical protein HY259_12770 [Chloroflexi bacterium]|nr:hypothetical protein [Chloroflexota bacterium]